MRGTYDALAAEPVLEHLTSLGVTALELLPVHAFADDRWLLESGLVNYWGYNSIGFFALEPRYLGPAGPAGFRETVRRLHAAGIEVILDVAYNHSAEGDQKGPTLSFRGLDNAAYYRLQEGNERYYCNDTGCGNALDVSHPYVLRLVLDSLRWWVEAMGVDGFRFDLATTLGRESHGFDPGAGFFDALRQDPVLAHVKLIAEPWDLGPEGYRRGEFPPGFAEWNDAFRDGVRRFWRGDAHGAQEMAERLLGSAGTFDRDGRRSWSSVNFVACHDGFTLADVTAYGEKRNEANREDNRDGHGENLSDNCGEEGESGDPGIRTRRARRQRNLLAGVFLAQGTPMLRAGDEIGGSQQGNNNAWCQDNELSWIDWANADEELLGFTRRLSALRRAHPCLRQSRFPAWTGMRRRREAGRRMARSRGRSRRLGRPGPCRLLPAARGVRRGAGPCLGPRSPQSPRYRRLRRSDGARLQPGAPRGLHPVARVGGRRRLASRPGHRPSGGGRDRLRPPSTTRRAGVDCRLCCRRAAVSTESRAGRALADLAAAMGVLPRWRDLEGAEHTTGPDTQRALLAAMGVPATGDAETRESLAELHARRAARRIPEEIVLSAGNQGRIPLRGAADWQLLLEDGTAREGRDEGEIVLTLPAGLHRLSVAGETCLAVAAPDRAPAVRDVAGRGRAWGLCCALYALRSGRNLGVGDYRDLADAARQAARVGGRLHRHQPGPRSRNGQPRLQPLFSDLPHRPGAGAYCPRRVARIRALCQSPPAAGGFAPPAPRPRGRASS